MPHRWNMLRRAVVAGLSVQSVKVANPLREACRNSAVGLLATAFCYGCEQGLAVQNRPRAHGRGAARRVSSQSPGVSPPESVLPPARGVRALRGRARRFVHAQNAARERAWEQPPPTSARAQCRRGTKGSTRGSLTLSGWDTVWRRGGGGGGGGAGGDTRQKPALT